MPFASKAQAKMMWARKGEMERKGIDVDEWSEKTDYSKLPERAKKKAAAMFEPWIGVDFDGTLSHDTGWNGPSHIGAPVKLMVARVKRWLKDGKTVKIFTARVANGGEDAEKARKALRVFCKIHFGQELDVTAVKDPGCTEIWDDRAVGVKKNQGKRASVLQADVDDFHWDLKVALGQLEVDWDYMAKSPGLLGKASPSGIKYGLLNMKGWERRDPDRFYAALRKGMKVEAEHTSNAREQMRIALDHLVESKEYYDHLEDMEADMKEAAVVPHARVTAEPAAPRGDEVQIPLLRNPYDVPGADPNSPMEYENGYQHAQTLGHQVLNQVTPEQIASWSNQDVAWRQGMADAADRLGCQRQGDTIRATISTENPAMTQGKVAAATMTMPPGSTAAFNSAASKPKPKANVSPKMGHDKPMDSIKIVHPDQMSLKAVPNRPGLHEVTKTPGRVVTASMFPTPSGPVQGAIRGSRMAAMGPALTHAAMGAGLGALGGEMLMDAPVEGALAGGAIGGAQGAMGTSPVKRVEGAVLGAAEGFDEQHRQKREARKQQLQAMMPQPQLQPQAAAY